MSNIVVSRNPKFKIQNSKFITHNPYDRMLYIGYDGMPKACDVPTGAINTTQAERSVVTTERTHQVHISDMRHLTTTSSWKVTWVPYKHISDMRHLTTV